MDRRQRPAQPVRTLQERGRLVRPAQPPWFERGRADLEGEDAEAFFRGAEPPRPDEGAGAAPPTERAPAPRRTDTPSLRRLLGSRAAVRRAILLAEVLAPPRALRRADDS